ncbi:MAG: redoxin domain-containing protein [Ginsengibacter sp.]
MFKKKLSFWLILLMIISAIVASSNIAVSQSLPSFRMQLTNGNFFSENDLPHDKPVIIIYFAPDCEHCQALIHSVLKRIHDFKKVPILLVTFNPMQEVAKFEKEYQTSRYSNIIVGTEIPVFFFRAYFNIDNTPFTALFDKKRKLVISYKKETPVEDLVKHLRIL